MKPMLPTLTEEIPKQGKWNYEVKYDGFRGILKIDTIEGISLTSRNNKDLLTHFPEIKEYAAELLEAASPPSLPLVLDGEIVLLRSSYSSEFFELQIRGRMKNKQKIKETSSARPVKFLAFDLIQSGNELWSSQSYTKRKKELEDICSTLDLPLKPDPANPAVIQMIPFFTDWNKVWSGVTSEEGEGVVAKLSESKWEEGKRSSSWLKIKNWKKCLCFVTSVDVNNDYFHIGVFDEEKIKKIGLFHFGISPSEKRTLKEIIKENHSRKEGSHYYIEPAICVEVLYLNWYEEQLREPHFHEFKFASRPEECTLEQFLQNEASIPQSVEITHPDKPLWEEPRLTKLDYIRYLRRISVSMLPFLHNRPLTCIRYPHGMFGESFYQKNVPDYAPDYIETHVQDGIEYIVCNELESLMWLGNQLALEFHIPFQKTEQRDVNEIVFDLDPPSREQFPLAVKAALIMKELFEGLKLKSFVKTSGNKGLQIYIPIPAGYSWKDTGIFTEFIAHYLVSNYPDDFTIERMKKNRKGRLYVDYIQHAEGKTIIAPYSLRGNDKALVAAPLWWNEVNEELTPEQFTMEEVLSRFSKLGCPFSQFERVKENQPFHEVIEFLKGNSKK
ncbi:DNA ligase D [Bacillus sp. Marseille-Q1617]|uniref:DNA ligase D n=1 Tax=Bacillus sp. Marseille-Q1617 TaxID=2736887 RepID=UPI00158D19CD|nr:DNA ligase D [Bacillus sp. Marseille-Q1617]